MLAFVLIIVILQLWLLTATMNAWLGGDDSVVLPAAAASLGCLGLNAGVLWYLSSARASPATAFRLKPEATPTETTPTETGGFRLQAEGCRRPSH